jgi:hypothetical protein
MTFRNVALLTIAGHFLVSAVHGAAHQVLHIKLSPFQLAFVFVITTAAPLLSAILLLMRRARVGAFLLMFSMAASLLFGLWHHYIQMSPDHISQVWYLPNRYWSVAFQFTASLLAVIELFGTVVGLYLLSLRPINIGRE